MADFVQTLMTALAIGSLYALIALGYTMVYGILKFINFAHSDLVVLGAWSSYKLSNWLTRAAGLDEAARASPPLWIVLVVVLGATTFCALVGFIIERCAYRPLRQAPRINVLITAIGVSLFLQNVGQLDFIFGASPERMPTLIENTEVYGFSFGTGEQSRHVAIGLVDVLIFGASATLMLVLQYVVFHTRIGAAMRAVSFSTETAALMGINVDRVISITFLIGTSLAAVAGFLYAMKYPSLQQPAHTIWVLLGLKAFVAAVIGGIGNVRGAVLGGFVIAFVEQFGAFYISSNYRDVYVFSLLIVILLVRPSGLLGSPVREKV